jgi:hypothetical protein
MPAGAVPPTAAASPVDPRLQRAIRTPAVLQQAAELVRLALQALADMRGLDDSLYQQFVATRSAPADPQATVAGLGRLWDQTFRGLGQLLEYCRGLGQHRTPAAAAAAEAGDAGFDDLDFGEDPAAAAPRAELFDPGTADIGSLLDGIGGLEEGRGSSDADRWAQVVDKVGAIEFGLRSQLDDATQRKQVALAAGTPRHVLGVLDDTQGAASEGVHALVTAVYAEFVPDADPARLVPGYQTSLGRALLVRRGIADLAARVQPLNDAIQGDDPTRHAPALDAVREAMRQFVGSAVCRGMRAADRWQVVQFEQQLAEQPPGAARQTCEGLAKYLESLASINQREVLVLHDQRKLDEMRELLATARQLLDLSPRTALEMLTKAQWTALALRGRSPAFDRQLDQVEALAIEGAPAVTAAERLERLEGLLAAAGG